MRRNFAVYRKKLKQDYNTLGGRLERINSPKMDLLPFVQFAVALQLLLFNQNAERLRAVFQIIITRTSYLVIPTWHFIFGYAKILQRMHLYMLGLYALPKASGSILPIMSPMISSEPPERACITIAGIRDPQNTPKEGSRVGSCRFACKHVRVSAWA